MIVHLLKQYLRIIGTSALMVVSVLFYSLSFKKSDHPTSPQFDIIHPSDTAEYSFSLEKFWGLTGPLNLLTEDETDRLHNVIEIVQYRNTIRRDKRQKMVNYLVKKYHLNEREARTIVRSADTNARKYKIDLELLLAIIFVESAYQPEVESNKGAIGLMQVVPKWHLDKIEEYGDVEVLYDIRTNINIGTAILAEYIRKEGNVRTALHRYNGSKNDKTLKYSNRVFQKYYELKERAHLENAKLNFNFDIISPAAM